MRKTNGDNNENEEEYESVIGRIVHYRGRHGGGVTVVIEYLEDIGPIMCASFCSNLDDFSRKKGVEAALENEAILLRLTNGNIPDNGELLSQAIRILAPPSFTQCAFFTRHTAYWVYDNYEVRTARVSAGGHKLRAERATKGTAGNRRLANWKWQNGNGSRDSKESEGSRQDGCSGKSSKRDKRTTWGETRLPSFLDTISDFYKNCVAIISGPDDYR